MILRAIKMSRNTPRFFQSDGRGRFTAYVEMPTSWQAMTESQLRYVLRLMADGRFSQNEVAAFAALRFARLELRQAKQVDPSTLADLFDAADFIKQMPSIPVRPDTIGPRTAKTATLQEATLAEYLTAENLYQGYLVSQNKQAAERLADLLYERGKNEWNTEDKALSATAALVWFAGLKTYLAATYPRLFRLATEEGGHNDVTPDSLREGMECIIRTLTGGDVTKREAVLHASLHAALYELEQRVREADKLKKK